MIYLTVTNCCCVSWSWSLSLIHKLYTTLQYRKAIKAVENAGRRNHDQLVAFAIHSFGKSCAHLFALSSRPTARNNGMLNKVDKIQELAMITWSDQTYSLELMWQSYLNDFAIEASDIEALKETFLSNSEEEIAQALENTSSRSEAAEKLLPADSNREPIDGICTYVIQTGRKGGELRTDILKLGCSFAWFQKRSSLLQGFLKVFFYESRHSLTSSGLFLSCFFFHSQT